MELLTGFIQSSLNPKEIVFGVAVGGLVMLHLTKTSSLKPPVLD